MAIERRSQTNTIQNYVLAITLHTAFGEQTNPLQVEVHISLGRTLSEPPQYIKGDDDRLRIGHLHVGDFLTNSVDVEEILSGIKEPIREVVKGNYIPMSA